MQPLRKAEFLPLWAGLPVAHPPAHCRPAPTKAYRKVRRAQYLPVDTIVIHATAGGSSAGAMSVSDAGTASWHALIPDEDELGHGKYVYRCVPDESAAWHVLSKLVHPADHKPNINDRSFGVEVVNQQDGRDPFSDWQLRVTAELVRYWRSCFPIKYLYTHAYLDPRRKDDPTDLFDWEKFMGYVLEKGQVPELTVTVDGNLAEVGAWVDKGTSYAPLARLVAAMGGAVSYDAASNQIRITMRAT